MFTKYLLQTTQSIKTILSDRKYFISFIFLAAAFFVMIFEIQIGAIPGNSLRYQAGILGYKDWIFFGLLAILNALFVEMEIYIWMANKKEKIKLLRGVVMGGVGTSSGIIASIFGVATCSLCVSAIFSFLGANSVIFLVEHKTLVTLISVGLLMASLVLTSARFNTACEDCKIRPIAN